MILNRHLVWVWLVFLGLQALPAAKADTILDGGTSTATRAHVCDLVFLEQSFEPDPQSVQGTLGTIFASDYQLFFSDRFTNMLIAKLYTSIQQIPGNRLDPDIHFDSRNRIIADGHIVNLMRIKGFRDRTIGNRRFTFVEQLIDDFWGPAKNIALEPKIVNEVAESAWTTFVADLTTQSPIVFLEIYGSIQHNQYQDLVNVVAQIEGNPRLKAHILKTVGEVILRIHEWNPKEWGAQSSLHIPPSVEQDYFPEYQGANRWLQNRYVNSLKTVNIPAHALAGAKPPVPKFDFSAIREAFGTERSAAAANELQRFYLLQKEDFTGQAFWNEFYFTGSRTLKNQTSINTRGWIEATAHARSLLIQYQGVLLEIQKSIGIAQTTIQKRMDANQADSFAQQNLSAQLNRILAFSSAVQSGLLDLTQAMMVFDQIDIGNDSFPLKKETQDRLRDQLKTIQALLKLNPDLLKSIKKGLFG